jgi:hypothetical protein
MDKRVVAGEWEHTLRSEAAYVFELLTSRRAEWVELHPGEVMPQVVSSTPDSFVVWSSFWPISPADTIEITLRSEHRDGEFLRDSTILSYRWLTDSPPDERGIAITRQRLNKRFGGDIRGWTGRYEDRLDDRAWEQWRSGTSDSDRE